MGNSDATQATPPPDPNQQQQIEVDDGGVATQYANFFAATGNIEEVIFDFGNRGKTPQDKVKIESKSGTVYSIR